jgi:nucleoside-diphosphate-sugar epimerase
MEGLMKGVMLIAETLFKRKLDLTHDYVHSAFRFRYFSNARARKDFDWKPEIPFESTISDTIDWMKKDGLIAR